MDKDYVFVGLGVLFISTRILHANTSHLFALIVASGIIYYLKTNKETSIDNVYTTTEYKLKILGDPDHFHFDVNFINLFYSIYTWRSLNENNFDSAIESVNNLLQLEGDSENKLVRCVDNYEVAEDYSKNAMNLMHGFIYSISQPLLVTKLKKVLERLQQLLERHLSTFRQNCDIIEKNKPKIDLNTRYIYPDGPQPYNPSLSTFDHF